MTQDPLLIIGAENIAKVLGFSPAFVRSNLLGKGDFPAQKKARKWITTRRLLSEWVEGLIDLPAQHLN